MLHRQPQGYIKENLVYVPMGADKGDCPHCNGGVLRRENTVQESFSVREGYICARCGTVFIESDYRRYFKRVAAWGRPSAFNVY